MTQARRAVTPPIKPPPEPFDIRLSPCETARSISSSVAEVPKAKPRELLYVAVVEHPNMNDPARVTNHIPRERAKNTKTAPRLGRLGASTRYLSGHFRIIDASSRDAPRPLGYNLNRRAVSAKFTLGGREPTATWPPPRAAPTTSRTVHPSGAAWAGGSRSPSAAAPSWRPWSAAATSLGACCAGAYRHTRRRVQECRRVCH